jgi:hypothetical protein
VSIQIPTDAAHQQRISRLAEAPLAQGRLGRSPRDDLGTVSGLPGAGRAMPGYAPLGLEDYPGIERVRRQHEEAS